VRLGLVIYGSLATVSGGYLYDRLLVKHLREAGDRVDIISLPWRNYARHFTDNFSAVLTARLRAGRFDALLQDELNHPSLFLLNRAPRGRYPILSIVHHLRSCELHPAWQNVFYRWIERQYLASVDGFIFNSATTRAAVETLVGDRRPAVVAHPGGDHLAPTVTAEQIRARALQPGPLRLLFAGNVIARKGLHTLLAALARLSKGDWRLEIVGSLDTDPAYAQAVRRQIERDDLAAYVTLHGSLADADLAAEFARAQVLVVPSSYEGFGIVYLEGMGFGLPPIATTAGAAGEIITHGENGFLVPPSDGAALADGIRLLMQDRERLSAMSLAARQRYDRHPSWQASAAKIREFIEEASTRFSGKPA
jgi:glycosyltransferase involved in cell wall biosynthesis